MNLGALEPTSPSFQVFARLETQCTLVLNDVRASTRISELCEKISAQNQSPIPMDQLRLIYAGQTLEYHHGIGKECTIYVALRLRGS